MSTRSWYQGYLQTEHWRELRAAKLEDSKHKCEKCPSRQRLEVHHLNYNPYKERLSDLQVLCENCHEETHAQEKAKLAPPIPPKPPLEEELEVGRNHRPFIKKPTKTRCKDRHFESFKASHGPSTANYLIKRMHKWTVEMLEELVAINPLKRVRAAAIVELARRERPNP